MKRKTLTVVGGALLLLCLAVAACRWAVRPTEIAVRFEGCEGSSAQGWFAVFRATNGTSHTVFCRPCLRQGSHDLPLQNRSLRTTKILAPGIGVTWLYPMPGTNVLCDLQVECWETATAWDRQLNRVIGWLRGKFPRAGLTMRQGREYVVNCPTEAR